MPSERPESAIVVRVRVPPAIERLRRRWDRAAGEGVPAHVTILYPFMPPGELGPAHRGTLAAIATGHEPFEVTFARLGRFPGVVYAAPDPPDEFLRLTAAVAAAFPAFPPYGGAFDEVIPHLTLVESSEAPLDEVAARAEVSMPFFAQVTRLEVLIEGPDDAWQPRWRIGLGRSG